MTTFILCVIATIVALTPPVQKFIAAFVGMTVGVLGIAAIASVMYLLVTS